MPDSVLEPAPCDGLLPQIALDPEANRAKCESAAQSDPAPIAARVGKTPWLPALQAPVSTLASFKL